MLHGDSQWLWGFSTVGSVQLGNDQAGDSGGTSNSIHGIRITSANRSRTRARYHLVAWKWSYPQVTGDLRINNVYELGWLVDTTLAS